MILLTSYHKFLDQIKIFFGHLTLLIVCVNIINGKEFSNHDAKSGFQPYKNFYKINHMSRVFLK
ncbi:hypothetical protein RhiirA4_8651 [Rhizophagus irregularis]|uniref:Uncharacterized protein n=1 Tax=Rhizophagus irregularis TaxID=588596 RepID=A0A2I1GYH4_9GLOM|nr:hypothetical protein RhiirA4_8651 [Rhizophagus irregularis]